MAQAIGILFHEPGQRVWLSTIVGIFVAVLSPPVGQIANLWGRRWPLVLSSAISSIGCIITSRAHSMGGVIGGFVVMSLGFGAQALLLAVVSEVLPRRQRPQGQAIANCGNLVGTILAICMGGGLLQHNNLENYRIYFYVTAGIFALATLGLFFGYNPPVTELQTSLTVMEKLRRLDWIGMLLFTGGLVLFCIGLSWSRNPYPWSDARVSATFAVGLAMGMAFFIYEWRFKTDGLFPHVLFQRRNLPLGVACIACEGVSFFTVNSFFILQVITYTGENPLLASMHYLLTFITALFSAILAGFYMTRTRTVRLPTIVGFLLILIFNICMATTNPSTEKGVYWGYPIILGAGFGVTLPSIMVAVQMSTPPESISLASALFGSMRALGATVGLAINNAIYESTLATQIPKQIGDAALALGLPESSLDPLIQALTGGVPDAVNNVRGATPNIIQAAGAALVKAYSIGFRNVWIGSACFIFLATVCKSFST